MVYRAWDPDLNRDVAIKTFAWGGYQVTYRSNGDIEDHDGIIVGTHSFSLPNLVIP